MPTNSPYDATKVACFREDPETFRLKHRLHLQPAGWQEAPDSGNAFHAALKVWFDQASSDLDAPMLALRKAWTAPEEVANLFGVPSPNKAKPKRPLELFERILKGYAQRWPRETEPFEIVRNEAYVSGGINAVSLGATGCHWSPFDWCGIIDRKIRTSDGCEYVMDTKTTSAWLNDDYFAGFRLGVQLPGYVGLELVNGRRCDGYYIDAVHVDTRYHKVRRDHFVRHGPIKLANWELTRWARDVEHTLREIERLDEERGPNEPWPVYANFKFNRVKGNPYFDFFSLPPELHPSLVGNFEERAWEPAKRT